MQKVVAGLAFMLTGALLVFAAAVSSAVLAQTMTEWMTDLGQYGTAMMDTGMIVAMIFGVIFIVAGLLFVLWGFIKDVRRRAESKK